MNSIGISIDKKPLEELDELAKKHGFSRSKEIVFLIKFYKRMECILNEDVDALPYYLEDMDDEKLYELKNELKNEYKDLKSNNEM